MLLTQDLRERLPKLYAQEGADDPIVHAKFFTPDARWTWYVMEGSEDDGDFRFFGVVEGMETEWGYFSLSELEAIGRRGHGLPIERDLYFEPKPFSQIQVR